MAANVGPGVTGNTVAVSTTEALVVGEDSQPRVVYIKNVHATLPVFIGGHTGADLTAANGFQLDPGEIEQFTLHPLAELYVSSASGTPEIRFMTIYGAL